MKKQFLYPATLLVIAAACVLRSFSTATGPVYIYTLDTVTGKCNVKDSLGYYIPAEKDEFGATAIQGNIGNEGGDGHCDTIYVIESDKTLFKH